MRLASYIHLVLRRLHGMYRENFTFLNYKICVQGLRELGGGGGGDRKLERGQKMRNIAK